MSSIALRHLCAKFSGCCAEPDGAGLAINCAFSAGMCSKQMELAELSVSSSDVIAVRHNVRNGRPPRGLFDERTVLQCGYVVVMSVRALLTGISRPGPEAIWRAGSACSWRAAGGTAWWWTARAASSPGAGVPTASWASAAKRAPSCRPAFNAWVESSLCPRGAALSCIMFCILAETVHLLSRSP